MKGCSPECSETTMMDTCPKPSPWSTVVPRSGKNICLTMQKPNSGSCLTDLGVYFYLFVCMCFQRDFLQRCSQTDQPLSDQSMRRATRSLDHIIQQGVKVLCERLYLHIRVHAHKITHKLTFTHAHIHVPLSRRNI